MIMRAWLAAATMACGLLGATGAGATTFLVTVLAPAHYNGVDPGHISASGAAFFPEVDLHAGDVLDVDVEFGQPIAVPYPGHSFEFLNGGNGQFGDGGKIVLRYPFQVSVSTGDTGFEFEAAALRNFGTPDTNATFNIDYVSYAIDTVPEPTFWALLIFGLGSQGAALRLLRRARTGRQG